MEIWNCTPNVPHTGGTFNFPPNTTSQPIVYTITYSNDDGCTAQTTYTVENGQECHCNCSYFDVSHSETFPTSGGSIGSIGSWTDVCPPTVNSKPDWVTVNINDDHSIMASADENTSSSQRNGVVTFSYNGEICDKKMNVTQYGSSNCEMRNRVNIISVSGLENLKSGMPFSVDSNGGLFYVEYIDYTNCDGVVTETYNSEFDFTTTGSSDYNVDINVGGSWLGQYSVHGSIEYESTPGSLFMDNSKTLEINGFNYPNAIKMYYGEIIHPTYKHELYLYCVDSTHDGDTFEVVYEASNGVSCTIYISFSPTSIYHTFDFYGLDELDY